METVGGLLGLAAMIGFVLAFVCLIRPIKAVKMGTRKRALIGMGISFVVLIIAGSIMPKPTPEELAARQATEAAAAEKSAADKAGQEKADNERAAAALAAQKPAIAAAAQSLWTQVATQVSGCDTASGYVADVAGRRNPNVYDLYSQVTQADTICSEAASNVGRISVPDTIPSAKRAKFKEAIETCRNAYYAKASAFDQMSKVLNGDVRPSAVNEAKQASEAAQAGSMLCAIGFMTAGSEAGLTMEETMGADFKEE